MPESESCLDNGTLMPLTARGHSDSVRRVTSDGTLTRLVAQDGRTVVNRAPERFAIVPDDYHVPYAGTAEDGRRFFLSDELFSFQGWAYVGLFPGKPMAPSTRCG